MRHWRKWSKTTRLYAVRVVFWVLFLIPAMLWWRESIVLVIFLSVWALVESTAAGFQSSRAKDEAAADE